MLKKLMASVTVLALTGSAAFAGSIEPRKDFQVFKDVASSVDRYTQFTIFDDVSASVKDGVVTLTGKVTMPYKRSDIEKRVAKVNGVVSVRDQITVLPVSQFDDELRYRIARSIYGNSNFWNYAIMSALAWKSLFPAARDAAVVWTIGLIGTALSAIPGVWLERYTSFMVALGAVLVPVGGVLVAHYYLRRDTMNESLIVELYDGRGRFRGVNVPGMVAWAAGAAVFYAAGSVGGTLPALITSIAVYTAAKVLKV